MRGLSCRQIGLGAALFSAISGRPAAAQDENTDTERHVISVSDLAPPLTTDILALPSIAFEPTDVDVPQLAPMAVEALIESDPERTNIDSRANRQGREDDRPRFEVHNTAPFAALAAEAATAKIRPDWMLAHFIDVGQGNATLLEFSFGLVLIDTGGQTDTGRDSNASLKGYLDAVSARRTDLNRTIAAIFLTHPHIDHTRGAELFTAPGPNIRVGTAVANSRTSGSGSGPQNAMVNLARARQIPYDLIDHDEILRLDGLSNPTIDPVACLGRDPEIRVLWRTGGAEDHWAREANNNSVVIRVDEEPQWSANAYGHPNLMAINRLRNAQYGVSMRRPQVSVPVGIKGASPGRGTPPVWRVETISHANFFLWLGWRCRRRGEHARRAGCQDRLARPTANSRKTFAFGYTLRCAIRSRRSGMLGAVK